MKQLFVWLDRLLMKHKALKRWKRIMIMLAAIMTFATTYALILSAITVETNRTDEVGGMYLERENDREDLLLENALEPTDAEILSDDADEDAYATEPWTDAPAVGTLEAVGDDYAVTLTYDAASGIPKGAVLDVFEIPQDSEEYQTFLEETKKAMGLSEEDTLPSFAARFFDIKIMVGSDEFTPESGVSVEITYAEPLAEISDTEVSAVHFADESAEAEVIEANTTEILDGGAATVEFMAETFSVYGVIYTQITGMYVSDSGETWKITVIYDEDAGIPDGAELDVTEITPDNEDYYVYLRQTKEELGLDVSESISGETQGEDDIADREKTDPITNEGNQSVYYDAASSLLTCSLPLAESMPEQEISFARFFDIHIISEGEIVEPLAPVTVKIEYEEAAPTSDENADVKAVHFARDGIELIDATVSEDDREFIFEQSSFSVTGTVVTANQNWQYLSNGKYVMYVTSGGKNYAIRHDRSLTEVTIENGMLVFANFTALSDVDEYLWDFEAVQWYGWNHYISYVTGGTRYYIDPVAANDISTTRRNLQRESDGRIYSYFLNNQYYLGVSGNNIVGRQNSGNAIQFANAFQLVPERYVNVHFVDRKGNPLQGVNYNGGNSAVVPNGDGTYKILYNWHGQTGSVKLDTDFTKAGYTYANSHLAGTRQGTELTHKGLVIDAELKESGNTLHYYTDTGEEPNGNRRFDSLIEYDLNAALRVYYTRTDGVAQLTDYSAANADSKDIYVILDPIRPGSGGSGTGSGGPGSGSQGENIDVNDPDFLKTMEPNGDGTYTISLNVTGKAKNQTTNPKANVVLVVDTSSSMDSASGTSGTNSRLQVMKDALSGTNGISNELFAHNGTDGRDNDTVEVTMITFDGSVVTSNDWMKTKNAFDTKVNGLTRASLHRGTDWEDALNEAYSVASTKMRQQPEETTFIVFFTDGEPSQYTQFQGAGDYNEDWPNFNESGYRIWYSYFLSREAAKDEARAIVNDGIRLYGIFAFNSGGEYEATGETGSDLLRNTIGYAYNMSSVPDDTYFYNAGSSGALTAALSKILKSINEAIGIQNVHMHDDITGLTSVGISIKDSGNGN